MIKANKSYNKNQSLRFRYPKVIGGKLIFQGVGRRTVNFFHPKFLSSGLLTRSNTASCLLTVGTRSQSAKQKFLEDQTIETETFATENLPGLTTVGIYNGLHKTRIELERMLKKGNKAKSNDYLFMLNDGSVLDSCPSSYPKTLDPSYYAGAFFNEESRAGVDHNCFVVELTDEQKQQHKEFFNFSNLNQEQVLVVFTKNRPVKKSEALTFSYGLNKGVQQRRSYKHSNVDYNAYWTQEEVEMAEVVGEKRKRGKPRLRKDVGDIRAYRLQAIQHARDAKNKKCAK